MTCYSLLHSYEWVAHAEQIKEIQQRVAFYLQPLSVLNSIFPKNYYNSWRRGSVTMTSDNDDCLLAVSLYVWWLYWFCERHGHRPSLFSWKNLDALEQIQWTRFGILIYWLRLLPAQQIDRSLRLALTNVYWRERTEKGRRKEEKKKARLTSVDFLYMAGNVGLHPMTEFLG